MCSQKRNFWSRGLLEGGGEESGSEGGKEGGRWGEGGGGGRRE